MEGQQPGTTNTPNPSGGAGQQDKYGGAPDEIAQIDQAVKSSPPEPNLDNGLDSAGPSSDNYVIGHGDAETEKSAQPPQVLDTADKGTGDADGESNHQGNINRVAGDEQPSLLLSWQSRGDSIVRGPQWYAALFVITISLSGLTLLVTDSWLSALVVILAAVALIVVNTKGPNVQAYGIFDAGVQIEERFYGYDQLRSFSVNSLNNETLIELEPSKRFYPRITMHAGELIDQAQNLLSQFLPKNNREPDMIDKISQRLKL